MNTEKILEVIHAARLVLSGRAAVADEIGQEAERLLELDVPPSSGGFGESRFPVTAHIGEALKHGTPATRPLLDTVAAALPFLPWKYNYTVREDLPELGQQMAWGEIIGPEAPFVSREFCLGLTLIAPGSFYPLHYHPAIELYHVISGTAEWTLEGRAQIRPPGSFILHPPNAVHAMRTFDEPLLALYTWSGRDVITLSAYSPVPDGK